MADRYLCLGPPGCGKTTWIAHEVERALNAGYSPIDVDVRSLTRAAARQAQGTVDLPEECIGTLHSAAFRALKLTKDQVAESKIVEFNQSHPGFTVTKGKINLDDEGEIADANEGGNLLFSTFNKARLRMIPVEQLDPSVVEFAEAWTGWKRENDLHDFTDMLEMALTDTYAMPGSPRIMFVDEAQDTSKLGLTLTAHWGEKADKVILAADPIQCIYRWAGASPEDLESFVPVENRRLLRQSHRIPRSVHAVATSIAKEQLDHWRIEFAPRDDDGQVTIGCDPDEIVNSALGVEGTVMILASCSYMLDPVISEMRSKGVPFSNAWRPSRGDWNPMSGKKALKVADFLSGKQDDIRAMDWLLDLRVDGVLARGIKAKLKRGEIETPHDFASWVALFASEEHAIKALGERDSKWFLAHVDLKLRPSYDYLFDVVTHGGLKALTKLPNITVGTIHSTKGGEADHVFLMPDLSGAAWEHCKERVNNVGRMDVERTFYVGATRARKTLTVTTCSNGMEFEF